MERAWPAAALASYLILTVLLFHDAWRDPFRMVVGGAAGTQAFGWVLRGDTALLTWEISWPGYALTHGLDPLVSNYLGYPSGFNVTWTTFMTAPGLALWPIVAVAGPVFAYNVAITLALALSAWFCCLAIMRVVPSRLGAVIGGLVYGFSPYVQDHALAHLDLVIIVYPPILLALLHEILVRQRWPVWLPAVLLGLTTALQLHTNEELLLSSALMAAIGVVLLIALHPHRAIERIRYALPALVIAAVVAIGLSSATLAVQFLGPQRVANAPLDPDYWMTDALSLVVPTHVYLLSPDWLTSMTNRWTANMAEWGDYVGAPLALLLLLTVWWGRRNVAVLWSAGLGAVAVVLSMGAHLRVNGQVHHRIPLPWAAIVHLPLVADAVPARLSLYLFLPVSILVAFLVWRLHRTRAGVRIAGYGALALALVPLIPTQPWPALSRDVPSFFTPSAVEVVPAGSVALVLPFSTEPGYQPGDAPSSAAEPMVWQAAAGFRYRMPSGYIRTPGRDGRPVFGPAPTFTQDLVTRVAGGAPVPLVTSDLRLRVLGDLDQWQVQTVIVGPMAHGPEEVDLMTSVIGAPPRRDGDVWLWTGVRPRALLAGLVRSGGG
jgi:hypothetical protein